MPLLLLDTDTSIVRMEDRRSEEGKIDGNLEENASKGKEKSPRDTGTASQK